MGLRQRRAGAGCRQDVGATRSRRRLHSSHATLDRNARSAPVGASGHFPKQNTPPLNVVTTIRSLTIARPSYVGAESSGNSATFFPSAEA
jgi:hypothetical protein